MRFASSLFAFAALAGMAAAQGSADKEHFPPFQIAGNLYSVGTRGLSSYLVVTPKGNILINATYEENVPLIRASVEKLGFEFGDVRILLISQAHSDHVAGSARVKRMTGARYMVMDADVAAVESGGASDFQYGNDPAQRYEATKVDRILHDRDEVKLGDAVLVAHLTPGHTKGCTTWTMRVKEGGKPSDVVIVGGPWVNPGYDLVHNTRYPGIAEDYERMFRVLRSLPCDYFLGAHSSYFGMEAKYARLKEGAASPFLDPAGYAKFVATTEKAFRAELARQSAGGKP